MIRQLGPATLFCSFSSVETQWIHLLKFLGKRLENKDYWAFNQPLYFCAAYPKFSNWQASCYLNQTTVLSLRHPNLPCVYSHKIFLPLIYSTATVLKNLLLASTCTPWVPIFILKRKKRTKIEEWYFLVQARQARWKRSCRNARSPRLPQSAKGQVGTGDDGIPANLTIIRRKWKVQIVHTLMYFSRDSPKTVYTILVCYREETTTTGTLCRTLCELCVRSQFTSHRVMNIKGLWDGTCGLSSSSERTREFNHLQIFFIDLFFN